MKIAQLDFERNINNPNKITRATLQDTEYLEANLLLTQEQDKFKLCSQSYKICTGLIVLLSGRENE